MTLDTRLVVVQRSSRSLKDLAGNRAHLMLVGERGRAMAAMKPRTGDGPLEVTKEGRGIVMRVPLEGGGRLVVEMTPDEAKDPNN